MATLPPPPLDSALAQDGKLALPWSRWLQLLWEAVRGLASGGSTPGDWQPITGESAWVEHGSPYPAMAYRKHASGDVEVRGGMKNGSTVSGATLFTLAAEHRPLGKHVQVVTSGGGGFHFVEVNTDGSVKIYPGAYAINPAELSISGIRFPTT